MKSINIKNIAILASVAVLTGCGENAWNDKLDGFEVPPVYSKTETIKYTLTAADYSTLATLKANTALATTDEEKAALAAIGKNHCFDSEEQARKYLPAFFADKGFPYFTLNDGSSIKVTYAVGTEAPAEVVAIDNTTKEYKVTEEDYINAWESDEDYISAFAPMNPASSKLPGILKAAYPDAVAGDYVVANYNEATSNPIFGSVSGGETPINYEQPFTESIGEFVTYDQVLPEGLTYVWSWGGEKYGMKASGFANKTNYDAVAWLISPEFTLSGKEASFSFEEACNYFTDMETAKKEASVWIRANKGEWKQISGYGFPEKNSWDFIPSGDIDLSSYCGSTIQIGFRYESTAAKAGTWEVKNFVLTADNGKVGSNPGFAKASAKRAPVGTVETVGKNAIYRFDGSKWAVPANTLVLQPADYAAMGQKYGNLSGTLPETLLPIYLKQTLPYAQDEDIQFVAYKYYNGSTTSYSANKFEYLEGEWTIPANENLVTDQFNRIKGTWTFDPSVTMTLPAGKSQPLSTQYYQACVDWVYENIDKPLGATSITSGIGYVTSYGNNEYYSGTSAYQGNVDIRASAAINQYPEGYAGMSDDEIVETMKYRFCYQVFPAALSKIHADAAPIAGMEIFYTFNFSAYTGSTTEYQVVYKVVGPAKFEFVSCNWWETGVSALAD